MGRLYGRAGRLTAKNAGFRPWQLLLDAPRTDAPMHLPAAPAPAAPWGPVPNGTGCPGCTDDNCSQCSYAAAPLAQAGTARRQLAAPPGRPRHCSAREGGCAAPDAATQKQKNQAAVLASLTGASAGDFAGQAETDEWLRLRWDEFMEQV